MVTTKEDDATHFRMTWIEDPMVIIGFNFDCRTSTEREVVDFLMNLKL